VNYWDRAPIRWRSALELARFALPPTVARTVNPRFLIGVSPRFVGLHNSDMAEMWPNVAADGWTYDNCAHACYTTGTPDTVPTVVIPQPDLYAHCIVDTLLHEIGHIYDEATGFSVTPPATTPYSRENRQEAFAEAFALIIRPPTSEWDAYMRAEAFLPLRALIEETRA
jgi:hypothetical protein